MISNNDLSAQNVRQSLVTESHLPAENINTNCNLDAIYNMIQTSEKGDFQSYLYRKEHMKLFDTLSHLN